MPSNGSQWNEIVYSRMVETPIQVLINRDVKKQAMSETAARISIDDATTPEHMLIITSEAPPLNIMVPISALREAVRRSPDICKQHKSVLRPEEQELILAIRKAERTARDAYQADDGMHRSFALVEQMVKQRAMEPDPDPQPEESKPKTRSKRVGGSHVDKTKPKTTRRSRRTKAEVKDSETVPDQAGPVRDK